MPAARVAIVGTRDPDQIDQALAAADIRLDHAVMGRIDQILHAATPVGGPPPSRYETVGR
jgi:aryl-alcohol dehydrogenase-like predicted oxidoreductase